MKQWKLLIPYIKLTFIIILFYLGVYISCYLALAEYKQDIRLSVTKGICDIIKEPSK